MDFIYEAELSVFNVKKRKIACECVLSKLVTVCVVAIAFIIGAVLAPKVYLASLPGIDIKFLLLCIGYCFWGITQVRRVFLYERGKPGT